MSGPRHDTLWRLRIIVSQERYERHRECFHPHVGCGDPNCAGTFDADEYNRVERIFTPRLLRLSRLLATTPSASPRR